MQPKRITPDLKDVSYLFIFFLVSGIICVIYYISVIACLASTYSSDILSSIVNLFPDLRTHFPSPHFRGNASFVLRQDDCTR